MVEIDFSTDLVFFARNIQFYNRISIGKIKVRDGKVELIAMETLSARPIEDKVAMSMVLVERGNMKVLVIGEETLPITE